MRSASRTRATPCSRSTRGASARARSPSLDELARATGTNKFVLLRRFKRDLGITPHALLTAMRIDQARALLHRGVPSAEAALLLGFADQATARWRLCFP